MLQPPEYLKPAGCTDGYLGSSGIACLGFGLVLELYSIVGNLLRRLELKSIRTVILPTLASLAARLMVIFRAKWV